LGDGRNGAPESQHDTDQHGSLETADLSHTSHAYHHVQHMRLHVSCDFARNRRARFRRTIDVRPIPVRRVERVDELLYSRGFRMPRVCMRVAAQFDVAGARGKDDLAGRRTSPEQVQSCASVRTTGLSETLHSRVNMCVAACRDGDIKTATWRDGARMGPRDPPEDPRGAPTTRLGPAPDAAPADSTSSSKVAAHTITHRRAHSGELTTSRSRRD
jgi:hypothetical protein